LYSIHPWPGWSSGKMTLMDMSTESCCNDTGKNRSTRRNSCSIAILSTTDLT
jgi:hypothetical protein